MQKKDDRRRRSEDGAGQSIKSILISLTIVLVAVAYSNGFGIVVKKLKVDPGTKIEWGKLWKTEENTSAETTATKQEVKENKAGLNLDKHFEPLKLMVTDATTESIYTSVMPGEVSKDDRQLRNGEILTAIAKGSVGGRSYYELDDETYIAVTQKNIVPLESYIKLTGYISITYINTTGIKLRSYADFEADNVIGTVYVGEEMGIVAKIRTKDGVEAFITDKGEYFTTDNRYFNDFTVTNE